MKAQVILIVGIIIVSFCDDVNSRDIFRSKRAESDFILHSCIASAQLIRKHRTNGAQLTLKNSEISDFASLSPITDNLNNKDASINKQSATGSRLHTRSKGRHLVAKSTTDTPLGTVDVKAIRQDIPKVFKKKDPLPELDRNGAARKLDTDTPIIVVQPLSH